MPIDTQVVAIALDRVEGSTFERFVNDFYPAMAGGDYMPLGGMHDGGADAFGGDNVYERQGVAGTFYQASVQEDYRSKIRQTVARLREFGRSPRVVTYITSRTIRHIDVEEEQLTTDLNVTVRIRDGGYIASNINTDARTAQAFEQHLSHLTDYLKHVGKSSIVPPSPHAAHPDVFVFLRQELDRQSGKLNLVDSVIDSLVLWALEQAGTEGGTVEEASWVTAVQIETRIVETVPSAKALVAGRISTRLAQLSARSYPGGRQVSINKAKGLYSLPFETRKRVIQENVDDDSLQLNVLNGFYNRVLSDFSGSLSESEMRTAAEVTLRALQLVFEKEGLQFSNFITLGTETEPTSIADAVRDALVEKGMVGKQGVNLAVACLAVIRGTLYSSSDNERDYLGKLARTYSLLFTLKNEPRLVQYFQEMAADFYLYVGADILVRALSERYLPPPDRRATNTLLMAARAGTKLVLTEPVLDEVLSNLRSTDNEYNTYFQGLEHRVSEELAANAPKILLRSYLFARLGIKEGLGGPTSWRDYINQFCDHDTLHRSPARLQLQRYLQSTFAMDFRSSDDLYENVAAEIVDGIAEKLQPEKSNQRLAMNDALLACAVYGRRRKRREQSRITEFGFQTWWLTSESAIVKHTRELVRSNGGTRYMMRPDFLLNFMTFAPALSEVRSTFRNIFPGLLGVRLSRRMDDETFYQIMQDFRDAENLEPGRRTAKLADLADRLKSDVAKVYLHSIEEGRSQQH